MWCKLSYIAYFGGGKTPSTSIKEFWDNGDVLWITSKDVKSKFIDDTQIKLTEVGTKGMTIYPINTIVMVVRSGILRRTLPISITSKPSTINQDLKAIQCFKLNFTNYLYWVISALECYILENYQKDGTTVESIDFDRFQNILIPMPPINEQKRIVDEIYKWLDLITNIETEKIELESYISQTKSKILDLAIQGKLVPQDPTDEPAIELLKRINPNFTPCDNSHYENVPFEIPQSWCWTKLGKIGIWQSGSTPSRTRKDYYGGSIPWLKTGDLNDNYITDIPEFITELALKETSVKLNPSGSILIAMYGATIGKIGILTMPATTNQACCACIKHDGIEQKYLFYYLLSHKEEFIRQGGGGAQPNISKEKIIETLIPIPPLNEQRRIVNAIETIFSHLDIITAEL